MQGKTQPENGAGNEALDGVRSVQCLEAEESFLVID